MEGDVDPGGTNVKRALGMLAAVIGLVACGSLPTVAFPASPAADATPPASTAAAVGGQVSPSPSSSTVPTPSPAPIGAAPAYAVLVDLVSSQTRYTASMVGGDGRVVASVNPARRTPIATAAGHAVVLPYVSMSSTALYYVNGDSIIESIRPDGGQGAVVNLDLGLGQEAAFAVSPDGTRIAVSVLDFNQSPVHVTLYTDGLVNASGRKTIYESSSNYVWPVAWHAGLLVLAHAYGPFEESIAKAAPARDNPYSAVSYHLVDPATAARKVLMGACTVSGPLSPAGSGCIQGGAIDWAGNTAPWSTDDWGSRSSAAALSPDGEWMAAANPNDPSRMGIWRRVDGTILKSIPGAGLHDWAGWIDNRTLVVGSEAADWQPQVSDPFTGGDAHVVAARGFVAGVVPTNIV